MQTDGQMAVTFFQETLQSFPQSYGRNRDTLRAPFVAIIGSQDFQGTQHFVQVVERFAHAHKYHVSQRIPFRHRINLIQNLCSCQAGRVSLLSGHTEFAVHFASHLRRHAQSSPVVIRNIYGFYVITFGRTEQVFHRSVYRTHLMHRCTGPHLVVLHQPLTVFERKVCHLFNGAYFLVVQPRCNLPGSKFRHSQILHNSFQLAQCFA